jgi:hypothetical protein
MPAGTTEAASGEAGIAPLGIPGQENGSAGNDEAQMTIPLADDTVLEILGGEFIPDDTAEAENEENAEQEEDNDG